MSFPVTQFWINRLSTQYRLDQNQNGGGIAVYVWEDITWDKGFLMTMKHFLSELIFENASGYFVHYTIHLFSLVNSFSIT